MTSPTFTANGASTGPRIRFGEVVDLARRPEGDFLGLVHGGKVESRGYGGSVLAHALATAYASVAEADPDRQVHSLHGYFLRPVDSSTPVRFGTEVVRTGRNYTQQSVDAEQHGKPMFTMLASFKRAEPGAHVRLPAAGPDVPGPDEMVDGFADRGASSPIKRILDCRELPDVGPVPVGPDVSRDSWLRLKRPLGESGAAHACGLAYICDVTLVTTAFLRFGQRPENALIASLDHAMWFHRPARADDWVLYRQHSRIEADGRTFARGEMWQDGLLVASVAQEALMHAPASGVPHTPDSEEQHHA